MYRLNAENRVSLHAASIKANSGAHFARMPRRAPLLTWLTFLTALCALIGLAHPADAQNPTYRYARTIGERTVFNYPVTVAADAGGNTYVVDRLRHRVVKFDREGKQVLAFGTRGFGRGQLLSPSSIAVDADGNIYVSEFYRIQKFTAQGKFLLEFGNDGLLNQAGQMTFGPDGLLYVADRSRIAKFAPDGTIVGFIGSEGTEEGQFTYILDVAVDADGSVYVLDGNSRRVQKFDNAGNFVFQSDEIFSSAFALAVDRSGNFYVSGYNTLTKYDSQSGEQTVLGPYGPDVYPFHFFSDIVLDADGNLLVADQNGRRVKKISPGGQFLSELGTPEDGQLASPNGVAIGSDDTVYVADSGNNRIQKFSTAGEFLGQWGLPGAGPGKFDYIVGIDVDSSGYVYVLNSDVSGGGMYSIQKFDSVGNYQSTISPIGTSLSFATAIAVDQRGSIYIADTGNYRILKLNQQGKVLLAFGRKGAGNGRFEYPNGIAVAADGAIYVSDNVSNRIQKFSATGKYQKQFGNSGPLETQVFSPGGLAVDAQGNVIVGLINGNNVLVYDKEGQFGARFSDGVQAEENNRFAIVYDVAVDASGNVFVADSGNDRIQVWKGPQINPAPALTAITPDTLKVGTPDTRITLTGTGFVGASVVQLDGVNLPTTFVSATQLTALIPATRLATPGAYAVQVINPAPGGGTSNARTVTVAAAATQLAVVTTPAPAVTRVGDALSVTITIKNIGTNTAYDVRGKTAKMDNTTAISGAPATFGNILPGATKTVTLTFPGTAAQTGTEPTVRLTLSSLNATTGTGTFSVRCQAVPPR